MMYYKITFIVTLIVSFHLTLVNAHTWGDEIRRVSLNGTMFGDPGYPRGYKARSDQGFTEQGVLYQLPRPETMLAVIPEDALFTTFDASNYSDKYPKLKAAPGEWINIRYQENGHVSLPQNQPNKPLNRGTISVFFTTNATSVIPNFWEVYKWTADGTGGNGQGRLIATRNYDDGRCHQTNDGTIATQRAAEFPKVADAQQGTDLWCQTDIRLPEDVGDATQGTIMWSWNWPTLDPSVVDINDTHNGIFPIQGAGVKIPEVYTIVADIEFSGKSTSDTTTSAESLSAGRKGISNPLVNFAAANFQPANIGNAAIPDQLENEFMVAVSGAPQASSSGLSASISTSATTTITGPEFTSAPGRPVVTITAPAVHTTSTVYQAQYTQHTAITRAGSPLKRRNSMNQN